MASLGQFCKHPHLQHIEQQYSCCFYTWCSENCNFSWTFYMIFLSILLATPGQLPYVVSKGGGRKKVVFLSGTLHKVEDHPTPVSCGQTTTCWVNSFSQNTLIWKNNWNRFESEIFTPPTSIRPSQSTQSVSQSHVFQQPQTGQSAHKVISFIVLLHVLKTSASNGSNNKKCQFFNRKLWSNHFFDIANKHFYKALFP